MNKRGTLKGITGLVTVLGVSLTGLVMLALRQPLASATQVIDRDSSRIVVNGEKIFPFGMYHTSWAGDDAEKWAALEAVGAAGLNVMHPALDLDDGPFIDRAAELGVNLIVEVNEDEGIEAMVNAFKDHPAVIGWLIADDFNTNPSIQSPQSIAEKRQMVSALAPHQFTYMSGSTRNLDEYIGLADAIGIQTYSIPTDPLDITHQFLTQTIAATGTSQESVIANLQSYASTGRRLPTADEMRNITYQALIAGVDGILYYAYFDASWDIEQHPEMWEALTHISAELRQLTPIVLDGELSAIPSGVTGLLLGQWHYQNQRYLVVINTTEDTLTDISLPVTAAGITPMFPERTSAFALQTGTLTGTIGPIQVDVYILEG